MELITKCHGIKVKVFIKYDIEPIHVDFIKMMFDIENICSYSLYW